ncbi:peptidylprolyl isomerase [Aurantivibrio plasticivorans]
MVLDSSSEEKIEKNSVVGFHYKMCRVDADGTHGEWLETSLDGDPVYYLHGHGNLIPGMEKAMLGRCVGDDLKITVTPEEGYGLRRENAVQRVPIKHLHLNNKKQKLRPGQIVSVQTDQGVRNMVVVKSGKFNVDVDMNHPLAGLTLYYEVSIESVRAGEAEEIAHGHVHGPGGHQH